MKIIILATLLSITPQVSFAHEGHDHTPGAVAAPHGGIIQGTDHLYLELVTAADGIKVYLFTHELKPIATSEIKIEAKAIFPKKPKAEVVKLSAVDDAFEAKVEAKGAHRYTLELYFSYMGKKEKTKFNVEPQ